MQGAEGTTPCDPFGWDSAAASQHNSLTKLRALALAVPKGARPGLKRRTACLAASLRRRRMHVGALLPGSRATAALSLVPSVGPCASKRLPGTAAAMNGASRAPATSVSADCCIPAGLRLGPVPGTFRLGKYLSDRREPGPKKKVLAIPTFYPHRLPPFYLAQERGREGR